MKKRLALTALIIALCMMLFLNGKKQSEVILINGTFGNVWGWGNENEMSLLHKALLDHVPMTLLSGRTVLAETTGFEVSVDRRNAATDDYIETGSEYRFTFALDMQIGKTYTLRIGPYNGEYFYSKFEIDASLTETAKRAFYNENEYMEGYLAYTEVLQDKHFAASVFKAPSFTCLPTDPLGVTADGDIPTEVKIIVE